MKSTWPCRANISMTRATIGLPQTGIIGLGMYSVKGEARVPRPPAKITTFTGGPTLLEQQELRLYHARLESPGESLVAHVQLRGMALKRYSSSHPRFFRRILRLA